MGRYPLDDVDLIATEMFANAVFHAEHAGASLRVAVRLRGDLLRLEVRDPDRRGCVPSQASEWDDSGRGLLLIECLSHRWGTVPVPGGKVVFAEIASHGRRTETLVHA